MKMILGTLPSSASSCRHSRQRSTPVLVWWVGAKLKSRSTTSQSRSTTAFGKSSMDSRVAPATKGSCDVTFSVSLANVLRNMAESSARAIFSHDISSSTGATSTAENRAEPGSTAKTSGSSSFARTPSSNKTSLTVPPRTLAAAAAMGKPSPELTWATCSCARWPSASAISFSFSSPICSRAACSGPAQLRSFRERRTCAAPSSSGSTSSSSDGGRDSSPYLKAFDRMLSRMMSKRTLSRRSVLRCAAAPVVGTRSNGLCAATKRCHRTSMSATGSTASHDGSYRPVDSRISTALLFKTSVISSICSCTCGCSESAHDWPRTKMRFLSSWFRYRSVFSLISKLYRIRSSLLSSAAAADLRSSSANCRSRPAPSSRRRRSQSWSTMATMATLAPT
mmetsp:Transcript_1430/g.4341  ORF Transcript_1430/g.4341 Transcript_1430/m.4341 type:complete len:394 (-) Transcript_1430:1614-2795(-)